jgi:hypothetical protein
MAMRRYCCLPIRQDDPRKDARMTYFVIKSLLSGILIAAISEIARRSPGMAALVASLPLISILAVIWLWRDTGDTTRIADHLMATFWYVLPSLPMFVLFPVMLRSGTGFWTSLALGCVVTVVLYFCLIAAGPRFGIRL